MKKYLLTASFLLSGLLAFSQDDTKVHTAFSIGPSVGFAHSFMYPYITRGMNPVGNFGIMAIYAPSEHWGVDMDVRYSMEGSRTRSYEGPRQTDLDYLRIPVKAIYFCGAYDKPFRPKFTLGPDIGFLMKQTDTFDYKANPLDFGLNASAGFNYRLSTAGMWLNMDVVYYQGLIDVMQHTGVTELNANIGLQVGLAFGL